MQVYGFLEKAQLENVSADLSNTLAGLIWFNTTDSRAKFYDGGAIRSIVDANSTQTLTGKTLTGNIIGSFSPDGVETITAPIVSGALVVDQHTLNYLDYLHQTTPAAPSAGGVRIYSKNDNQLYKQDSEGNEVPIGTGGGGLDVFHIEDFEVNNAADFSTGNNATFLGGGSIAGALADETASPMAGNRTLKYTQAAGSLNDYFASPVIELDEKQAGNDCGLSLYFKYSGNSGDIKIVVYDVTNGEVISSDLDLIESADNPGRFSVGEYIPQGVTQIRWGAQVVVENAGAVLELDDVQFSSDPFVYKQLVEEQSSEYSATSGYGSSASKIPYWTNDNVQRGGGIYVADNSSVNGFSLTALKDCTVSFEIQAFMAGNNQIGFSLESAEKGYAPSLSTDIGALGVNNGQLTWYNFNTAGTGMPIGITINMKAGEILRPHSNGVINGIGGVYISATATTEHVVTPAKSNLSDWIEYTPTIGAGFGTVTNLKVFYRRVGGDAEFRGTFTSGSVTAAAASLTLPSGIEVDGSRMPTNNSGGGSADPIGRWVITQGSDNVHGEMIARPGDFPSIIEFGASQRNAANHLVSTSATQIMPGSTGMKFYFKIPVVGWDENPAFLSAIPVQRVAILKDEKADGVNGGGFPSGSWQTRDLNTEKGDTGFLTLSANQFTLPNGEYKVKWKCPAKEVGFHQSRLFNVTDGVRVEQGQNGQTNSAAVNATGYSEGYAKLTLTESKEFRIEHRCQSSNNTDGFGDNVSFGDVEVYTIVEITKLR